MIGPVSSRGHSDGQHHFGEPAQTDEDRHADINITSILATSGYANGYQNPLLSTHLVKSTEKSRLM